MITRNYFYLIETQEKESKIGWGIAEAKSWLPCPSEVSKTALNDFCKKTGKELDICTLVKFNKL